MAPEGTLTDRGLGQDRRMMSEHCGQHLVSDLGRYHERLIRSAQEDERAVVQYHTSRAFPSQSSNVN